MHARHKELNRKLFGGRKMIYSITNSFLPAVLSAKERTVSQLSKCPGKLLDISEADKNKGRHYRRCFYSSIKQIDTAKIN